MVAYLNRHAYVSEAISSGLTDDQTAKLVGNTGDVVRTVYSHAIEERDAERARELMRKGKGSGGGK